ncbi:MAG: hypothetical protein ACOC35_03115 [Promethearchaeia archaeon]
MNDELSSYQKGIENLLEDNREEFENIIAEYILGVHNKYFSNMFPSTQICKVLLDRLDKKKSKFSIFHKIVREILQNWKNKDLCEIVSQKKRHSIKTVVKFGVEGLNQLKQKVLDFNIKKIEKEIEIKDKKEEEQILKTREKIIEDMEYNIRDIFLTLEQDEEENN